MTCGALRFGAPPRWVPPRSHVVTDDELEAEWRRGAASRCASWCALRLGGTTCDCDAFERIGRGGGAGPRRATASARPSPAAAEGSTDSALLARLSERARQTWLAIDAALMREARAAIVSAHETIRDHEDAIEVLQNSPSRASR